MIVEAVGFGGLGYVSEIEVMRLQVRIVKFNAFSDLVLPFHCTLKDFC